uniref:Proteasome subunit alpha type n=1 Tax=Panagrellus redivivus TaxID=6233 RepID=A0A7E4ZQQ9_PANRE
MNYYPINEFSPSGRLNQVDYAGKAASAHNTAVGVTTANAVVIVTKAVAENPLMVASSSNSVFRIDDKAVAAFVGVSGDARPLANGAQQKIAQKRFEYGESPSIESMTNTIVDQMAKATMHYASRPFGVSVLVAGIDGTAPKLFQVNTSAESSAVKAAAIGRDAPKAQAYLEENFTAELDEAAAVALALKAILQTGTLSAEEAEIAIIKADKGYASYSLAEKRTAIEAVV